MQCVRVLELQTLINMLPHQSRFFINHVFFHSNLITITEIVLGVYQFLKHGVFTTSRHGGFMDGEMGPLFPYATYGVCVCIIKYNITTITQYK